MSEEALLAAVRDNPDDDLPRLAHADWLEEHGDEARAQFIRVQVERARLPPEDDRQAELEARERRLMIAHGPDWHPEGRIQGYRRGYPEALHTGPGALAEGYVEMLERWPIRELTLGDFSEGYDPDKLQRCAQLAQVESLNLAATRSESVGGEDVVHVLNARHLGRLRKLDVNGNELGDEAIAGILELPVMRQLEGLNLERNACGPDLVRRMVALPWPRLRSLSLGGNPLGVEGLQALFASPLWEQLEEVDLSWMHLTVGEVPGMADALRRLRAWRLELNYFDNTGAAVEALRSAGSWGPVTSLRLANSGGDFTRLLECPGLARLTRLSVPAERMLGDRWEQVASCGALAGLTRLNVGGRSGAFAALARSPHLTRLWWLQGWDEEGAVVAFVRSQNAAHVRWLNAGNDLTDRIAQAIAGSPYMRCLTTLHANSSRLTDGGAVALAAASENLPHLTFMDLAGCRLGARGQRALLEEADRMGWVGLSEYDLKKEELKDVYRRCYRGHYWGYELDAGSPYEY